MELHTGAPWWPTKDGLPAAYPTLTSSVTCEFVVLGAGIAGAIIAQRLAADGHDVVVLDKRDVASGNTSATTALVQYELDVPAHQFARRLGDAVALELHAATRRAVHDLERLAASVTQLPVFHRRPSLKLAGGRRDMRALHADFAYRHGHGFDVEWLSADDLATNYGMVRPAAVRSLDSGECDPYLLTHALLEDAARHGARVYDRVPVAEVMTGAEWGDDVIITTDTGHAVRARSIVVACGSAARSWLPKRAVSLRNTYAAISEPLPPAWSDGPWPDRALVWETAHPYLYVRTTDDRRVIVGGEDDRFRSESARDRRARDKAVGLFTQLAELLPSLRVEPAYAWSGTFAETPDGLPRIGIVDGKPNLFVAAGHGGNGIVWAMLAAEMLESRIRGEVHPLSECVRCDR